MFDQPEKFGHYILRERLAVGGMAEIFRATARTPHGGERVVALKRLHGHLDHDEELVQMLRDEASLVVQLHHPNIGQIFDLELLDGHHCLVMEYICGEDLHGVLRLLQEREQHLPTPIVLYIMAELLAGLHYAHELRDQGGELLHVVHRDVSPQNVMVSVAGEVKLIDFGIAKARSRVLQTQAGIIKGKFYYMSPEQAHGQQLDRRTDVFSAGMVMYELLTGRPAYEEGSDIELLRRVRGVEFEPASRWRADLDPNLEMLLTKALHRDRRQRYQSAEQFGAALQHYADHHFPRFRREEAARFIHGELCSPPKEKTVSDLMRREDFASSEHSLIFDPLRQARSVPSPPLPREEMPHFASSLAPGENPFADANEPTYIYTRADENPFAIPDTQDPETRPRSKRPKAPRRDQSPALRLPGAAPPPRVRVGSSALQAGVGGSAGVRLDNARAHLPASLPPRQVASPEHDSAYISPISLEPAEGTLGPKEITRITAYPSASALPTPHGFYSALSPQDHLSASPELASNDRPQADWLTKARGVLSHAERAPRRLMLALGAACVVAFGVATPFLLRGAHDPAAEQDESLGVAALAAPDEPAPSALAQEPSASSRVTLSVDSTPPGAVVLLDGERLGQTPQIINTLRVGDALKLELRLEGHQSWAHQVAIASASPEPIHATLERQLRTGVLHVDSSPQGLFVLIDNEHVGQTPHVARELDRSRSYAVIVSREREAPRGKRKVVSWSERDEDKKSVRFTFEEQAEASEQAPEAKRQRRTPKRRKPPRPKASPAKRDTAQAADKKLDVWGKGSTPAKPSKKRKLDVWGSSK